MPHIHEKIDYCSDTYIVNDGAVLLRKHDKYKMWLPPGGHVELYEDPEEAAVREVQEEVGLTVKLFGKRPLVEDPTSKEVLLPYSINRHRVNEVHEHIALSYFATSESREVTQGETEKSDEIRWFTKEKLEDPAFELVPRVRYLALLALEEVRKATK